MWERDEDRLALLELLEAGRLRRRTAHGEAWTLLDQLPWTRRTGRRDEFELVSEHKDTLVELLDRVWPSWSEGSWLVVHVPGWDTATDFWGEYIANRALPGEWPEDLNLDDAPALIRDLAHRNLWLEQELIAVDPRLRAALETAAGDP